MPALKIHSWNAGFGSRGRSTTRALSPLSGPILTQEGRPSERNLKPAPWFSSALISSSVLGDFWRLQEHMRGGIWELYFWGPQGESSERLFSFLSATQHRSAGWWLKIPEIGIQAQTARQIGLSRLQTSFPAPPPPPCPVSWLNSLPFRGEQTFVYIQVTKTSRGWRHQDKNSGGSQVMFLWSDKACRGGWLGRLLHRQNIRI